MGLSAARSNLEGGPEWAGSLKLAPRGADAATVEDHAATPPVVRLTIAMLDADDLPTLADECARGVLGLFGAQKVQVVDETRTWAEASVASDAYEPLATMKLKLSEEDGVDLRVQLPRGPDLPIVRQQLLDVAAVARRAWRDRRLLAAERRQAREDALTGLHNRRAIETDLEKLLADALGGGTALTVMLIDLDHFKQVNDTAGHPAGDEVLKLAAECFRHHLRPGDLVCRWGGDEFLIAAPGLGPAAAAAVADRLRKAFAGDVGARGTTMSIGVASVDALDPDRRCGAQLVALADQCLYEAKRAGRNRMVQALPATLRAG